MQTAVPETPDRSRSVSHEWLRTVIERSCREFAGRVTHEHIVDVAHEVASHFRDARVTSYVPILVSRFIREHLLQEQRKEDVK